MTGPRPMNVLAWVHLYPPTHNAGAEMMLHETLLGLRRRGHRVQVIVDKSETPNHEGVPVTTTHPSTNTSLVNEADIIITHLDRTKDVVKAVRRRKPIVHLVHNDKQLTYHAVKPASAQLVVFNSLWLAAAVKWSGPSMVMTPPIDPNRYKVTPGGLQAVTLVNMSEAKGGRLFWMLADLDPDHTFIGVIGGYGKQEVPNRIPPNVILMPHTSNIRLVYAQTRTIIMPSSYESFGRVGIEAAASGIPTIAHPTPGLQESLGASGTFIDRGEPQRWVQAIRALDNDIRYGVKSKQALERSALLGSNAGILELEARLLDTIHAWENR